MMRGQITKRDQTLAKLRRAFTRADLDRVLERIASDSRLRLAA